MDETSKLIRKNILKAIYKAGSGHIPSSFSIVEILLCLYNNVLTDNDLFILSKGHAGIALYAVLAYKKIISDEQLFTFGTYGSILGGHPDKNKVPGIIVSSGSLGHGLAVGAGIAL